MQGSRIIAIIAVFAALTAVALATALKVQQLRRRAHVHSQRR